jgi:hypothetical protein
VRAISPRQFRSRFSFRSRGCVFGPIFTLDLGNESDRHWDPRFGGHITVSILKLGVLLLGIAIGQFDTFWFV